MSQLPDGETPPGILHLPFIGKTSSSKISISRTLIVRNKIVSVNLFQILAIVLTTPPQNISRMFWTGKSAGTWTPPTRSLLLFSNAFANTPSQRLSFYFTNTKLSSRPLQWRSGLLPLLPVPFYHIRALFSIANPGQIFSAICLAGILQMDMLLLSWGFFRHLPGRDTLFQERSPLSVHPPLFYILSLPLSHSIDLSWYIRQNLLR